MKGLETIAAWDIAETQRLIDHPAVRLLRSPNDAFLRQIEPGGGERVPRVGRRQSLGYTATLLLAQRTPATGRI